MKLIKVGPKDIFEAIENIGNKNAQEWGDFYRDEVEIYPAAVMPVSYVEAVEQVKRWREKANKAIEERRKLALEVTESKDEDRFKNMSASDKKFNSNKLELKESLSSSSLNEDTIKVSDKADEFLIKLALASFHDWQQLALDLIDSMDDAQIEKFINDYNYDIETHNVQFEKEGPITEKIQEALLTPENIEDFTPSEEVAEKWEVIKAANKLDELKDLIIELYPDTPIEDETLNDLLDYDFDFIKAELGIKD